jgi:DNA-binding response OmpR family regulator
VARLRALARRPPGLVDELRSFADLQVNLRTRAVRRAGRGIELTAMEWSLLEFFVRNAGTVLDRASITAYVWDDNHDPMSNALEVLVSRLRRKVDDGFDSCLIETVRGAGYRFGP